MTPERWQQVKNLVNSALEQDAEQRFAVLQQSCAEDLPLRRGAEALLSFHEQATRNLANAPVKLSSAGTMPPSWQRIEQLFQSALELPAAERVAFLARRLRQRRGVTPRGRGSAGFQTGMGGIFKARFIKPPGCWPIQLKKPDSHLE